MRRFVRHYDRQPSPTLAEPRPYLLEGALAFVRGVRLLKGVRRIALIGSLTTGKAIPKDADPLVTIDGNIDLVLLARFGRQLKGTMQRINLGADIFLADETGRYIGRICRYRECHPRAACLALHCGRRQHLNDDLGNITLSEALIASPPVELWPKIVRRGRMPADTENLLLAKLDLENAQPTDTTIQ